MMPRKLFFVIVTLSFVTILLLYLSLTDKTSMRVLFAQKESKINKDKLTNKKQTVEKEIVKKFKPKPNLNKEKTSNSILQTVNKPIQKGDLHIKPNIVPPIYRNDQQAFQKYLEYLQLTEKELPLLNKAVILLTNYRSGSSFVGEFFNQHPDIFYSFEPLIAISYHDSCTHNIPMKQKLLADFSQCIIPNYKKYWLSMPKNLRAPESIRNIYTCTQKKFCFIPFTKGLCDEMHCPRSELRNNSKVFDCWRECGDINPNIVGNMCRRKSLVALKLIRLCNIMDLETLITDYNIDLKVVHLIRDPRGIAASRLQLHSGLNLTTSLQETCKRQIHNAEIGLNSPPEWLKGRYKMIRYEDAALYPFKIASELYQFLGVKFRKEVIDWLEENTGQEAPPLLLKRAMYENSQQAEENIMKEKEALMELKNPWGHKRDSKAVVQKWKFKLPFYRVKKIENVCTDLMKLAGYRKVKSGFEYRNKNNRYLLNITRSS